MGSKRKKQQRRHWVDYHISFHLGFCHGPVDLLREITMRDRVFWQGDLGAQTTFDHTMPQLFGGTEREGGAGGRIDFLPGTWDQFAPVSLASRLGLTPSTMPGFRGIASLVFTNPPGAYPGGFWVSSNFPSVPAVTARFRRQSWALPGGGGWAGITNPEYDRLDSNPAHIIYEALINADWGMNGIPEQIDVASFLACAETLFNEGFGLSFMWVQQSSIESFIQEVLDHINALFFYNPFTGLGQLRLIRKDYDVNLLPEIGPDEANLLTFRRRLWGETVNEVIVTWTNPESEQTETVQYQDLGNIAMQGAVVSENRNYYGVRSSVLASRIAARDIVAASMPLASATIEVDRSQWKVLPGDVIRFTWPDYEIDQLVMRIMNIDYGKPDSAKMRLELLEDVYGLNEARYIDPPRTEWEPPEDDPDAPEYEEQEAFWITVPMPLLQNIGKEVEDEEYPAIHTAAIVTRPQGLDDLISYQLLHEEFDANGDQYWGSLGEKTFVGWFLAKQSRLDPEGIGLGLEVESLIAIDRVEGGPYPHIGSLGYVGDDDEYICEIIQFMQIVDVETIYANQGTPDEFYFERVTWRVRRGMMDTVPRQRFFPKVYVLTASYEGFDYGQRIAFTPINYRIQYRTSLGLRDEDLLQTLTTDRIDRPYLPFRPANCRIEGVLFGEVSFAEDHDPRPWTHIFSWSRRNRMTEDTVLRAWNEAPVPEEADQFTQLAWVESTPPHPDDIVKRDIAGDQWSMDVFLTARMERFETKFRSERNGLISLQFMEQRLVLYRKGFGSDWGYFFGGWPNDPEFHL